MLTVSTMASRRHTAKTDMLASHTDILNATRSSQFSKEEFGSTKRQQPSQIHSGSKKANVEADRIHENPNEPDKRKTLSSEKGQASSLGELVWQQIARTLFTYPLSPVIVIGVLYSLARFGPA